MKSFLSLSQQAAEVVDPLGIPVARRRGGGGGGEIPVGLRLSRSRRKWEGGEVAARVRSRGWWPATPLLYL
jgi:hypothetical protein